MDQLNSLKEILLKKSDGNINLQTLIKYMGTDHLITHVVEALEKMARPTSQTGKNANAPVTSFGKNADKSDVLQLRDALSHHVSHYKAALKAHHAATDPATKTKMRGVADQHLNHLLPLMHLAASAGAHSDGKLGLDYVELPAWETNYTTVDRHGPNSTCEKCQDPNNTKHRSNWGKFRHDTDKLGRRPGATASSWSEDSPESRGVPDYRYLEMPPHHGHGDYTKMSHRGAYPWEEVQVGSNAELDAKKGYLHITDVPDKQEYTPHPFDKHPIRSIQDAQQGHIGPERLQQYATDLANWKSSDHHKQWLADQREQLRTNGDAYRARGSVKPGRFHEGIPPREQLGHVHAHPKPAEAAKASTAGQGQAVAPTVRKQTPENKDQQMQELYTVYANAPPNVKELYHKNKAFMHWVIDNNKKWG